MYKKKQSKEIEKTKHNIKKYEKILSKSKVLPKNSLIMLKAINRAKGDNVNDKTQTKPKD